MKTSNKKQKGFYYYCKGLTSKEIGKLLDVSYRTVQNWMSADNWKAKRNPIPVKQNALKLYTKGMTYKQISEAIGVSRSTISVWIKEARQTDKK